VLFKETKFNIEWIALVILMYHLIVVPSKFLTFSIISHDNTNYQHSFIIDLSAYNYFLLYNFGI